MAKRTINLVLEVVIEIIEWLKTKQKDTENGRDKNDSKRNPEKK